MDENLLHSISERLQRERRALVEKLSRGQQREATFPGDLQPERQEQAQSETASGIAETLEERQQDRVGEIDDALARMEAGSSGSCQECGQSISPHRLKADPTTTFCDACAAKEDNDAAGSTKDAATAEDHPERGALPPDLDGLDDTDLQEYLGDLVRQDGRVDTQELEIVMRDGVVYLEGAVPSEPQHAILLKTLTDVAGLQDIVDNLDVERLAWERDDRWKEEEIQDVPPGTIPNQEPYGGTEDVVLAEEEGVTYEPPENPPAPPNRKD